MAEKEPTPIRTDLFRFITIRTPQLIAPEKREVGFVYHPSPQTSAFLGQVDTEDIDEARSIVRAQTRNFSAFATFGEVRALDQSLYAFSSWLLRNKNTLTEKESTNQVAGLSLLATETEIQIWDNLFYQVLKKTTPSVRQACVQMLIANNYLKMSSKPAIAEIANKLVQTPRNPDPPPPNKRLTLLLRRIAKARVVIPKAFSTGQDESQSDEMISSYINLTDGDIALFKQHINTLTDAKIDSYNVVERELRFGLASLESDVKNLTSLSKSTVASAFLSKVTKQFVSSNSGENVTFGVAQALIKDKVRDAQKKAARAIASSRATKSGKTEPYCFVVSIDDMEGVRKVYFTIYLGYVGGFVTSSNYDISFDGGETISDTAVTYLNAKIDQGVILELFPQNLLTSDATKFKLRGNMSFNNGAMIGIEVEGLVKSPGTHGCASLKDSVDDEPVDGAPIDEDDPTRDTKDVILFGVNRLGIGVFRKVEQEVCCYVPGEVSRIENILAREYKERTTRSLISTEVTEEETVEIEVENQSDTVSTTRNELQTEIATELAKDTSIGTGASLGVEAEWPTGSVSADAYFDYATSNSSSTSDSVAQTYAQEVVDSALERVLQKTTQKRTSRILEEYEENNRHGFDNREGVNHVTGVYRWVDIIYTNRLVNYGKRLMLEFLIPEPARFYKMALEAQAETASEDVLDSIGLEEPTPPSEHGINSADSITEDNYLEFGRLYGVTLEDPITPESHDLTKSFNPSDDPDADPDPNAAEEDYQFDMNFVEFGDYTGYEADHIYVDGNFDYHLKTGSWVSTQGGTYFILKVENETISFDKDNLKDSAGTSKAKSENEVFDKDFELSGGETSISMTVEIKNVYNFSITLRVSLVRDPQAMENWRNSVYDTIMRAYEDQVAAYEAALAELEEKAAEAAEEAAEEGEAASNPDFNRTIEQRELQRIAIEMLTKPFGIKMGGDYYYSTKCEVPQVEQSAAWRKYSSHVKWFEQCMDWSLMAYLFYPYYWADKCSWATLLQTKDADDQIFEAFLQSGMARVVIPVRRGFEEAVDYYLGTGDIWNGGGLILETDDDLYLSIDEELKEPEGFVGREWQTRVPTSLTIVQGNSVYLEDEGLPCCAAITEQQIDTKLRGSDAILGEAEKKPSDDEQVTTDV
jgi:hypothetical protein